MARLTGQTLNSLVATLEVARPHHDIVEFMDSRSGLPKTREHFGNLARDRGRDRDRNYEPELWPSPFTSPNRMEMGGQMDGAGS